MLKQEWLEALDEHVPKISGLLINQWQHQEQKCYVACVNGKLMIKPFQKS